MQLFKRDPKGLHRISELQPNGTSVTHAAERIEVPDGAPLGNIHHLLESADSLVPFVERLIKELDSKMAGEHEQKSFDYEALQARRAVLTYARYRAEK